MLTMRMTRSVSLFVSFRVAGNLLIHYIIAPDNCNPQGCSRCLLQPSDVCCSLCTPNHPLFNILPSLSPSAAPKDHSAHASRVKTSYTMDTVDRRFQASLHSFQHEKTLLLFGRRHLNNIGPGIIMGNNLMEHIIACARVHKLETLEGLTRETKWSQAKEFGEEILRLVFEYVAPISVVLPLLSLINPPDTTQSRAPLLPPAVPTQVHSDRLLQDMLSGYVPAVAAETSDISVSTIIYVGVSSVLTNYRI